MSRVWVHRDPLEIALHARGKGATLDHARARAGSVPRESPPAGYAQQLLACLLEVHGRPWIIPATAAKRVAGGTSRIEHLPSEPLFVNRQAELAAFDQLLRLLHLGIRRHTALLGLRRIGTALLLDAAPPRPAPDPALLPDRGIRRHQSPARP